jgi:hypothetical protein
MHPENRSKNTFRSLYDYAMGILWICVGFFFFFHTRFGVEFSNDSLLDKIFGSTAVFYGVYRLYRGFVKKDFPDERA